MISTVGAQDVHDKVLDFFSRFIEFKLRITGAQQRGGLSSKRNPRAQQKLTEIEGGSQRQTSKGKGKRHLQADENFDDPGEAPDDEEPEAKRRKTEKLKIACPYMKRYPTEFCSWRTCVGPGFDGMNRMKEHLKRRHFKENGCHRCGLYLESNQALQDHLRSLDICPVKVILPQMGFMTQIQSEEISKKRQVHTIPLLQRWKEIYLILFPDADEDTIPGPYFEATETSNGLSNIFDPQEYEYFLKRHLPARILMNLNREFQIISDRAKAKLAEMLQEESLEVLKAYVLQKGGSSSQTLQTDSSGSELLDTGAIDNGLFDNIEALGDEGQDAFDFSFLEAYCQQVDKEGSEQADSGYGPSVL
ncbi:hypothetical protein CGCSCA1_v009620 [Colletotrichum siamense]|nr:hypothetical protein CGCSCA1_v009620 [Colletotrichum siamense]